MKVLLGTSNLTRQNSEHSRRSASAIMTLAMVRKAVQETQPPKNAAATLRLSTGRRKKLKVKPRTPMRLDALARVKAEALLREWKPR